MKTKWHYFYSEAPFSQWHTNAPVQFYDNEGMSFVSCEQYMMYQKAKLFGDRVAMMQIMSEASPKTIKAIGREVQNFRNEVWVAQRYQIVFSGNLHKFMQRTADRNTLLNLYTEGYRFAEASPYDTVWGIGIGPKEAKRGDDWRGLNLLGMIHNHVAEYLLTFHTLDEHGNWIPNGS